MTIVPPSSDVQTQARPPGQAHTPQITRRRDGDWGVICFECSWQAMDYVYPCSEGRWNETPPPVLVAR